MLVKMHLILSHDDVKLLVYIIEMRRADYFMARPIEIMSSRLCRLFDFAIAGAMACLRRHFIGA